MSNLSPVAQAVLDAADHTFEQCATRRPAPKPPETIEVDGFAYRLVQ